MAVGAIAHRFYLRKGMTIEAHYFSMTCSRRALNPCRAIVALFRGINVGKAKRIAMADLRVLLGKLGYTDVADAAEQRQRRVHRAPPSRSTSSPSAYARRFSRRPASMRS